MLLILKFLKKGIQENLIGTCLRPSGVPGAMLQELNSMLGTLEALRYLSYSDLLVACRRSSGPSRSQQITRGAGRNSGRDQMQVRSLDFYIETNHYSPCLTEYLNIFYEVASKAELIPEYFHCIKQYSPCVSSTAYRILHQNTNSLILNNT